ncbi:methyltransferase family protein [Sulfitobacter aestuariivivens]|uniref:Isoprenylcysteine carboxylmethyltransferase family protein n=1 Tax=Sulfitobacter aestuariivivens TaxID=2766981 RepID=A0A927D5H5_9RHOB|nr:isoprenylcysteine carboxylmethyltransferase family protein [Sulfitobacter aestuariivivens]MBD3663612.1 isoprenylcysteine carboxylmethyltransferase family protein [Sulfitobacter aestuariivivens]
MAWHESETLSARQMLDLPPVWLVSFIALVWLQVWIWPSGTIGFPLQGILSGVLFWGGLALMGWAIWAFRTHQTTVVPHQVPSRIITGGPFAFSRNPIYLGDVMVLAGVILGHGAWPALILLLLFAVILVRRFIAPEEARMKENFGEEFIKYTEKTRRWL